MTKVIWHEKFNCFDKETLRETFNYLNCALQHESLNRGPWKELERFERDLSKVFEEVKVNVIYFDNEPEYVEVENLYRVDSQNKYGEVNMSGHSTLIM